MIVVAFHDRTRLVAAVDRFHATPNIVDTQSVTSLVLSKRSALRSRCVAVRERKDAIGDFLGAHDVERTSHIKRFVNLRIPLGMQLAPILQRFLRNARHHVVQDHAQLYATLGETSGDVVDSDAAFVVVGVAVGCGAPREGFARIN